jgi:hypothetical protein
VLHSSSVSSSLCYEIEATGISYRYCENRVHCLYSQLESGIVKHRLKLSVAAWVRS